MVAMVALIWVLVTLKWGSWKEWKIYYPTILFFIAGNLAYKYVTVTKPLWMLAPDPLFTVVSEFFIMILVIFPCTVILLFTFYPQFKSWTIKTLYVVLWVLIYSAGEYLALKLNYFNHTNGWSFTYSILFNCLLFPLLLIHQRKPQLAWLIASIIGVFITYWFKIPATPSH